MLHTGERSNENVGGDHVEEVRVAVEGAVVERETLNEDRIYMQRECVMLSTLKKTVGVGSPGMAVSMMP